MGLDPKQLLIHVVRPALAALDLPGGVLAEKLVLGTACQESDGFRYIHQLGKGPALSLWQIEPATATDTLMRAPTDALLRLRAMLGWQVMDDGRVLDDLPGNLYLGVVLCRLVYYMKPFKMPEDPRGVGWCSVIWKKHYNTFKGAGTVGQFVKHWMDARLDSLWP